MQEWPSTFAIINEEASWQEKQAARRAITLEKYTPHSQGSSSSLGAITSYY
jgi:hypothetical protein